MEHKKKVLVIGRHAEMLVKIVALLNEHGYDSFGETTNDEAVRAFQSRTPDAVIIGGGVDVESRTLFHVEFPKRNPRVKIIDAHPQTVLRALDATLSDT